MIGNAAWAIATRETTGVEFIADNGGGRA